MQTAKLNLADLKEGDYVAVLNNGPIKKVAIDRVTPTMLIVSGTRYNRRIGYRCGSYYGARIEPWASGHESQAREERSERRRKDLAYRLEDFRWRNLSIEQLEAVTASAIKCGVFEPENNDA